MPEAIPRPVLTHATSLDKWNKPEGVPDTGRHRQASFYFAENFQDQVRYNTP